MIGAEIYNRVIELNEAINTGEASIRYLDKRTLAYHMLNLAIIAAKVELKEMMEAKYKAIE